MKQWLALQVFKLFIYLSHYATAEEYWDDVASKYGVITGKDAERFREVINNPKRESPERIAEMWKNYESIMAKAKL